jgi:DNA-binding LacI/PurR family transcriptional regulator
MDLQQAIRDGRYQPGSRMPSHRFFEQRFGASSVTVQRAFASLAKRGYVETPGRSGTFVSRLLPHRSHIALVFADMPERGSWNRFWSAIRRAGEEWSGDGVCFRNYFIADGSADAADHLRLIADVDAGVLAGIAFVTGPEYLPSSPVVTCALPRIYLGASADEVRQTGCSSIVYADAQVPQRIVDAFHADGRRRMAAFTPDGVAVGLLDLYRPFLEGQRMETRREWWLGIPIGAGSVCARAIARLLVARERANRPDCILIADDNLVPHVTAGIQDAGASIIDGLSVLAHANFPRPTISAFPIVRYGLDVPLMMRAIGNEVVRLASGGKPRVVEVPYVLNAMR